MGKAVLLDIALKVNTNRSEPSFSCARAGRFVRRRMPEYTHLALNNGFRYEYQPDLRHNL